MTLSNMQKADRRHGRALSALCDVVEMLHDAKDYETPIAVVVGEPPDPVDAVAKALIFTHPHHGWFIGPEREDGLVPLRLDGGGEYHDHAWLIDRDGTVRDG